ncbi:Ion transport 2 domain protein [Gloeothece citriformis PCC 7424]|uniref:Ion transport 2 domain protein n=1 Tax=Gloeothece citriformis (strain PCC 7424) TaxID=65393 RepID=B7KEY1_GLOC7|nr:potassium channel family protein [Gloeothece citriformis]ACK70437.1 Ion transport 2 domain protein [Gloeothece citriformis PCC 7424]
MKNLNFTHKQAFERERYEILQQIEEWLDFPMLVLSFIWLILFVVELIWGLTPFLDILGTTIWIIFGINFALEFFIAPRKLVYLKSNWLIALSLLLPALRLFRFLRYLKILQSTRSIRGLRLLRLVLRTNRGMRALASSFQRRGFGYILGLSTLVVFLGATGMYVFERDVPNTGLPDYGTALWWTAMIMTTMGSDYFPKTPEGRLLCWFLSLYAVTIFGYLAATLATFFIGRDADNSNAEVAGEKAIADLKQEIASLRGEIQSLLLQKTDT